MAGRTKPGLRVNPDYCDNVVQNKKQSQEEPAHRNEEVVRLRREIARNSDRRHTLGISHDVHARKQDRFKRSFDNTGTQLILDYLIRKYPEHADSIVDGNMDIPNKTNSPPVTNGLHDEETGTMSETDTLSTGFKRGTRYRSSLPIVRPRVNMSKEKPLGLIYLQYMNETKRALMPNEVTGMDTVRALFVRAFARKLTMNMLEAPERKIYIRDPMTEIFYELENLREIQDRTVLKIYEPGYIEDNSSVARSSSSTPIDLNYYSEPELEMDYPDTRRNRFHTMSGGFLSSAPKMTQDEMIRPSSTTPLEMGRRVQQDSFLRNTAERSSERLPRPSSSTDSFLRTDRSSANVPRPASATEVGNFQRGTLERSSERVMRPNQDAFQRGGPERSSERLPRPASTDPVYQRRPPGRSSTLPAQASPGDMKMYQPHPNTSAANTKVSSTASTSQSNPPADNKWSPKHSPSQPDGPIQSPQKGSTSPIKAPLSPQGIVHRRDVPAARSPSRDPYGRPARSEVVARTEMSYVYASPAGKTATLPARPGSRQKGPPPPTRTTPVSPPEKPQRANGVEASFVIANRQATTGVAQPTRRTPTTGPPPVSRQGQVGVAQARPVSQPIMPGGLREPDIVAGQRSHSANSLSSGRSTPMSEVETTMRIAAMEQQIANLAGMVRSALSPSNGETKTQKTQPPHRPQYDSGFSDITGLNEEIIQMTQQQPTESAMDERSGKLRPPNEGTTSTSVTPQPMAPFNTVELQNTAATLTKTAKDLREQLQLIRKLHLNMTKEMNDSFRSTANKVKLAMETNPGVNEHPLRKQRSRVHQDYLRYVQGKDKIDRELRALEAAVEEVRNNVVNKHSKVNIKEVDKLAQALGNSSRHIAEQKAMFPLLSDNMKAVMSGEMNIVVQEENFLKDEPGKLDDFLKRCKKLTGTLFTLKRLASVQDHRPNQPTMVETNVTVTKEREVLLERVPNRPAIQRGTPTQSKIFTPPPGNNVQTVRPKAVDQLQSRKHPSHSTTYDIVLFTQDLITGKCRLRTTGYLSAHSHRQKKLLWEMYSQEQHDKMTPILTPEKAARRGSPSKSKAIAPPPPPKRTYTSQQAVVNLTSPTSQSSSMSGGGTVVKTTTTTHQNGKVITSTSSTPDLSSSISSVSSDDSLCFPRDQVLSSKSTGSLLVRPQYHTHIIDPDLEKSKSQPLLINQAASPSARPVTPREENAPRNRFLPDCVEGHFQRQRLSSMESFLSVESAMLSKSAPCSPRTSLDESGNRPPKPPRGCVEAPAALTGRRSPSAFTPVQKASWTETCLDHIPIKKQHSSLGGDHSDGVARPLTGSTPNTPNKQNGYSPIKAEWAARLQDKKVSPKTPSKTNPSHLPTSIILSPPPPQQRHSEPSPKQSKQPPPPPIRTTSQRSVHSRSPFRWQSSFSNKTSNKTPEKTSPSKIPHITSPNSRPQTQPQKNMSPKLTPSKTPSNKHIPSTDIPRRPLESTQSSPRKTPSPSPDKLRVVQLKEQYAKLRQLQEKHKQHEKDEKSDGLQETDIDDTEDENTESQDESSTSTTPTTTSTTKVEISDQVAPATTETILKETTIYRNKVKQGETVKGVEKALNDLESLASESLAESPSSVNGTVQAPIYSHVKTQQIAPREFATKAKSVPSKDQDSPGKGQGSPSKGRSSPGKIQTVTFADSPSRAINSAVKISEERANGKGCQITDIDKVDKINDYSPRQGQNVIKETVIDSDSVDGKTKQDSTEGDGKVKEKVKGQNVVIIEVSTERKATNTNTSSGRKTPTSNVVELFDAKTDGTLIF